MPARRPRKVRAAEDQATRRQLRAAVGRLSHNLVQPRTLEIYQQAVRQFSEWVASRGMTWSGAADHVDKLDLLVAEWIEWLWTEGHPQGLAGNTLSAVQFFLRKKRILPASWRLLRAWQNLELPQRVLPLPEVVLLAMAATARGWGRNDLAALLVLGFAGFLRTTEMITLRRWQVAIDEASARIIIILPITKSGLRFHTQESVVIDDGTVVRLLSYLLRHLAPEQAILSTSATDFREKFEQLTVALECQQFRFKPYSLRRGGATSYFKRTRNMPATLERGRWQDTATARIYIAEGQQALSEMQFSPVSYQRLSYISSLLAYDVA